VSPFIFIHRQKERQKGAASQKVDCWEHEETRVLIVYVMFLSGWTVGLTEFPWDVLFWYTRISYFYNLSILSRD